MESKENMSYRHVALLTSYSSSSTEDNSSKNVVQKYLKMYLTDVIRTECIHIFCIIRTKIIQSPFFGAQYFLTVTIVTIMLIVLYFALYFSLYTKKKTEKKRTLLKIQCVKKGGVEFTVKRRE